MGVYKKAQGYNNDPSYTALPLSRHTLLIHLYLIAKLFCAGVSWRKKSENKKTKKMLLNTLANKHLTEHSQYVVNKLFELHIPVFA